MLPWLTSRVFPLMKNRINDVHTPIMKPYQIALFAKMSCSELPMEAELTPRLHTKMGWCVKICSHSFHPVVKQDTNCQGS